MGNVRPENVKRVAHELIRRYPDRFTTDFEENKKVILTLIDVPSTTVRNNIAGYVTRLVVLSQRKEQS